MAVIPTRPMPRFTCGLFTARMKGEPCKVTYSCPKCGGAMVAAHDGMECVKCLYSWVKPPEPLAKNSEDCQ